MRYYLKKVAVPYIIILSFVTLLPSGIIAANDFQHTLNNFKAENSYVMSWKKFPNNKMSLVLIYDEGSPLYRSYFAYAELENSGNFILEPDSIYNGILNMPSKVKFFDDMGRLYMYDNRNGGQSTPLERFSYDPQTGKAELKKYKLWQNGHILGGAHVAGVGNVLITIVFGFGDSGFRLIIEDPLTNYLDVIPLDLIKKGFGGWDEICIYKLSENRILVIGITPHSLDGITNYSMVSSLVYDFKEKHLVQVQRVPFDSLAGAGAQEFESVGPSQIFKKDGILYYLALGESLKGGLHRSLFVPIDYDGKIKLDIQALQMNVEYQSLDSTPEQFILLRGPEQSRKFWMMSLDTFPTIVIDKGE